MNQTVLSSFKHVLILEKQGRRCQRDKLFVRYRPEDRVRRTQATSQSRTTTEVSRTIRRVNTVHSIGCHIERGIPKYQQCIFRSSVLFGQAAAEGIRFETVG